MKSTGIIRRIDELGRIVIPKEIRRTLGLKEGDPMEISTDKDTVCFTKYIPQNVYRDTIESLISNMTGDYGFNNQKEIIQRLKDGLALLDGEQM